jgi:hypothetical protein
LYPHTSFDDETRYLLQLAAAAGLTVDAAVLGEPMDGLQWHVLVAAAPNAPPPPPSMSLEVRQT